MKRARINTGAMRERITLQRPVKTANAINEVEVTYEDVACVACRMRDAKTGSGESFQADMQVAIGRKEALIRYHCNVTEEWRVVYRQVAYDILVIQEPVIRRYQTLIIEKRGNAVAT